jgi:predicted transcriptional regulator
MDTASQIKKNLISRIKDSKDLSFLRALQTIFDAEEQALFQLTQEQSKSIEIGRDEIKNGNYADNNEVISEMREWLEKK